MANEISFEEFNAKYAPKQQDTEISFDDFNAKYSQEKQANNKEQDYPLTRGYVASKASVSLAESLATHNYDEAAKNIAEQARYAKANPGSEESVGLQKAWKKGDGILGGIANVAGEIASDYQKADGAIAGAKSLAGNAQAMGSGIVAQMPNMVLPMAGMVGGGLAGSTVSPVIGTILGAWAGASTGNALVGTSEAAMRQLEKAGINPEDTEAVKAYLQKNSGSILGETSIKGGVIGAVDTATMGLTHFILTGPGKAAADRALAKLGVDTTNSAAVSAAAKTPQFKSMVASDPVYIASKKGAGNAFRNIGAASLEPVGEFTGEYAGSKIATGEADAKDAFLEAASSLGQSGATFAGQKLYAGAKYPLQSGTTPPPNTSPPGSPPPPDIASSSNVDELISATKSSIDVELDNQTNQDLLDEISASNNATSINAPVDQSYVPQPDTEPRPTIEIAPDVQPTGDGEYLYQGVRPGSDPNNPSYWFTDDIEEAKMWARSTQGDKENGGDGHIAVVKKADILPFADSVSPSGRDDFPNSTHYYTGGPNGGAKSRPVIRTLDHNGIDQSGGNPPANPPGGGSATNQTPASSDVALVGKKEPWQMTKAEYDAPKVLYSVPTSKADVSGSQDFIDRKMADGTYPADTVWSIEKVNGVNHLVGRGSKQQSKHSSWIIKALSQGEHVPDNVLADYPNLTTPASTVTNSESQPTEGQNVQDITPETQIQPIELVPETGNPVGVDQEQVATQVAVDVKHKTFEEIGRLSNDAQKLVDARHSELDAQGVSWDDQKEDAKLNDLYEKRIAIDTAAAQKAYEGAKEIVDRHTKGLQFDKFMYGDAESILRTKYGLDNGFYGAYSLSKLGEALGSTKAVKSLAKAVSAGIFHKSYPNADFETSMTSSISGLSSKEKARISNEGWVIAEEIHAELGKFFMQGATSANTSQQSPPMPLPASAPKEDVQTSQSVTLPTENIEAQVLNDRAVAVKNAIKGSYDILINQKSSVKSTAGYKKMLAAVEGVMETGNGNAKQFKLYSSGYKKSNPEVSSALKSIAKALEPAPTPKPLSFPIGMRFDASILGLDEQNYKSQNELSIAIAEAEHNLTAQGKEALEALLLEDQFDSMFGEKLTDAEIESWLSLLDNNEENDNSTTQGTTESGVTESTQSGEQNRDAEAQGKAQSQVIDESVATVASDVAEKTANVVAPKPKRKVGIPKRMSLLEWVASEGGFNRAEIAAEIGRIDDLKAHKSGIFGSPSFRVKGGQSWDKIGERLAEAGYLPKNEHGQYDKHDLFERIDAELDGEKQYTVDDIEGIAETDKAARELDELRGEAESVGVDWKKYKTIDDLWVAIDAKRFELSDADEALLEDVVADDSADTDFDFGTPVSAAETEAWLNGVDNGQGNQGQANGATAGARGEGDQRSTERSSAQGEAEQQTPDREFALTSQTEEDIKQQEERAADTSIADREAADRASEVPLTLAAQSSSNTGSAANQSSMFTPDGRASKAADQANAGKEPWQMTQAEWLEHFSPEVKEKRYGWNVKATKNFNVDEHMGSALPSVGNTTPDIMGHPMRVTASMAKKLSHKALIAASMTQGKPVPAEVLADYPDLKPAQEAKPSDPISQMAASVESLAKSVQALVENQNKPETKPEQAAKPTGTWYVDATERQQEVLDSLPRITSFDGLEFRKDTKDDANEVGQATFDSHEMAPGIRRMSLDGFALTGYNNAKDTERIDRLATAIKESGEITPLIASVSPNGEINVEEGQHRARALRKLGYDSVPVRVIVAMDGTQAEYDADTDAQIKAKEIKSDVSKKAENVDTSKERVKGIDISAEGVRDEPAAIEDFGQKIEGAKKDMAAAVSKEYGDDDLVTLPLSKIWPANLSDKIEDNFVAAFAYAARAELPSKPRKPYAVKVWIGKVKALREMVSMVLSSDSMRTKAESLLNETKALEGFNAKVKLLESLDREQWGRIGNVREYPGAYRYEGENQVPSPYVAVSIDDRTQIFAGETSVSNVVDKVNEKLGIEKQAARMKFEVRGRGEAYFINKAGDSEYRKLKTFKTAKEALDYRNDHYDDLVAAWEDVKDRDNVKKDDVRGEENRPRTAEDWRKGKDVTVEQFSEAFGFRGGQFGNWVSQGSNAKERQWMLNNAYDAFMDLASILNIPPKAVSLDGQLGISFGARGRGKASAHFESDAQVINLTKTRGAGVLAHEWFHALDNYFQRSRNAPMGNNRESRYVTYRPEPFYVHKGRNTSVPLSKAELKRRHEIDPGSPRYNMQFWEVDKNHPQGIRPEVEERFAALVESLNDSPMTQRALVIDKGKEDGYWSRIIERAARSFENYVIAKMSAKGFNNDYLANVVNIADFKRDEGRYPYLKEEELAPVVEAFDNLFGEIKSKETDKGTALFSKSTLAPNTHTVTSATTSMLEAHTGKIKSVLQAMLDTGKAKVVTAEQAAGIVGEDALYMTAWHGSPHDHDGFSMDKVGTGEGAQAYGHGLYFAGRKEVAEWYKNNLSSPADVISDGAIKELEASIKLLPNRLRKEAGDVIKRLNTDSHLYNIKNDVNKYGSSEIYEWLTKITDRKGRLYQVELTPNEDEYLLYDKPLSEQSEKVKSALLKLNDNFINEAINTKPIPVDDGEYWSFIGNTYNSKSEALDDATPLKIISGRTSIGKTPKDASDKLHAAGIRGVKYFDGTSRSRDAGENQFNYVIFNDQDVKITAKFAKEGQALAFYNPIDGITYFIADHIPQGYTAKEWEGLVMHEISVHALSLGKDTKEFKSILRQVELMRQAGNKTVVAAFKRVPKDTRPENVTEEAIAYLLQEAPSLGISQRVIAWFRNAIRVIGKSFPTLQKMRLNVWANNLNESDLRFMAELALKNAERSGVQNESDTPQFSKSSQTDTPAFKKWFGESKVVNPDGTPKIVYHFTDARDITAFDMGKLGEATINNSDSKQAYRMAELGFWFTNKDISHPPNGVKAQDVDGGFMYSDVGYPVFLSIKNPRRFHTFDSMWKAAESFRSGEKWRASLVAQGYDGAIVLNDTEFAARSYIAFNPVQIKSIFNNGDFSPSNNNILFSKNTNPVTHPFQPENSGKPLDSWIKIFTRNQIVTLYRDSLIGKKLEEYKELRELVTADTNKLFEKADNFLLELRQIPKGLRDAFASLAHDSTLNNVDPSNPKYVPSPDAIKLADYLANNPTNQTLAAKIKKRLNSMEAAHKKLYAEFNALPAKEQELFKELRSKYTEQMTMVFNEFKNRIGRMKSIDPAIKASSVKKLDEQLADLLGRVYFPLYRAGNYIVKAEKAGEPTTVDHVESNFAADRLEKKLKKLGYTVSRSTRIVSPQDNKSGEALNAVRDLLDKAALKGKIEGAELSQLMDDIDQTILQSLPDQSYRKSFIHRKGTKGYSDDFIRAYADAMRRGSINIANLRHGDKITTVIEDMRKDVKDASKVPGSNVAALNQVVDRVEQIEVDIRNPTSKLVSVSGKIAFAQMLGSLSNFILNITQTPLLTMPHLGAEYGYGKANLQLAMAYAKQMRSLKKQGTLSELGKWLDMRHGLIGNELDLMQQLHDSGFLDLTQSFDLIDAANNPSYQENELSMNVMKVIALPQHVSEIVNRQVTALATIRLEMARSGSPLKAYHAARKAIDQTHFNYSKENRAKLMTGNTQSILFRFKQYAQQAAFLFVHTAKLALDGSANLDSDGNKLDGTRPSERTKARKQLAGVLGMQILVAGTLGLPIFAEAAVAASGVAGFKLAGSTGAYVGVAGAMIIAAALAFGDDDGEEFDVEVKKWFIKNFGYGIGSSLASGVIPRGLSTRLDASELIIRRPEEKRTPTDTINAWMLSLLGPILGGIVYNAGIGVKEIAEGDIAKGATKLIPVKAIKDLVTSWKWANDGMNVTNKDGEIITPVSKADIFFKSIGINPTSVVNAREYDNAKFTLHNALLKKQQKALKELREETDKAKRFNAIIKYNKFAPLGYEIDSDKVRGVIAREIKYKGKPNVVTGNPVQEDYLNKNTRELRPAY